jgi:hypothetical protein
MVPECFQWREAVPKAVLMMRNLVYMAEGM